MILNFFGGGTVNVPLVSANLYQNDLLVLSLRPGYHKVSLSHCHSSRTVSSWCAAAEASTFQLKEGGKNNYNCARTVQ